MIDPLILWPVLSYQNLPVTIFSEPNVTWEEPGEAGVGDVEQRNSELPLAGIPNGPNQTSVNATTKTQISLPDGAIHGRCPEGSEGLG